MKNVVIDTCTIIHIIKGSDQGLKSLDAMYALDKVPNIIMSVVSKAEMQSFSKQNNWGASRIKHLTEFLEAATIININENDNKLLEAYAFIDGYSKRKLPDTTGNLLPGSSRTMGKNDLWIAATAMVIDAPLITTDGDFDHLNNTMLNVFKIS
jgi:predicted nucleic acid-binding protein